MSTTTRTRTEFVTSADGTRIAYETSGKGPALVLVDGALCQRTMGPSKDLTEALAGDFTVYAYDRRGRGESGPGASAYDLQREVEDLVAVITAAGGRAHVFGSSSGGALALEAARAGAPIERIVSYEAPFVLDKSRPPNDADLAEQVQAMVDDDRRGDAVKTFMRTVGVPGFGIVMMRLMPIWKKLTGVAHTLPYDLSFVVPFQQGEPLPDGYYDAVRPRTLVIAGGKSPGWMQASQAALSDALPDARLETLPGQTHMIRAKATAPAVARHLLD